MGQTTRFLQHPYQQPSPARSAERNTLQVLLKFENSSLIITPPRVDVYLMSTLYLKAKMEDTVFQLWDEEAMGVKGPAEGIESMVLS